MSGNDSLYVSVGQQEAVPEDVGASTTIGQGDRGLGVPHQWVVHGLYTVHRWEIHGQRLRAHPDTLLMRNLTPLLPVVMILP